MDASPADLDTQPVALTLFAVPPLLIAAVHATTPPSPPHADNDVVAEIAGQPLTAARMRQDLQDNLGSLEWDTHRAKVNWAERQALLPSCSPRRPPRKASRPIRSSRGAVDARTRDAERSVDEWMPPPASPPTATRPPPAPRSSPACRDDATAQFVDDLKRKYGFKSHLRPPEPREADLDPDQLGHRLGPDKRRPGSSSSPTSSVPDARPRPRHRRRPAAVRRPPLCHLPPPPAPGPRAGRDRGRRLRVPRRRGEILAVPRRLMARNGRLDGVDLAAVAAQSAGIDRAAYDACVAPGSAFRTRVSRQTQHAAALGLEAIRPLPQRLADRRLPLVVGPRRADRFGAPRSAAATP